MSKNKSEGARGEENKRANEDKQSLETETIFDYVHLSEALPGASKAQGHVMIRNKYS